MSEKTVKRIRKAARQALSAHVIGAHNIDEVLARITRREVEPELIIIDLFCGAGGTTTGFARLSKALVVACVNHDYMAIKSHWLNHPEVAHFEEDIRILDLVPLKKLVKLYRKLYPNAKIVVWASLECTNFSKAKGGMPRDADSRTLADHLHRYIEALNPDYIMIENVVEFMSWGPLTAKVIKSEEGYPCCQVNYVEVMEDVEDRDPIFVDGEYLGNGGSLQVPSGRFRVAVSLYPESKKNGREWLRWRREINAHGYRDEWRELNSADFGAYTSRNRLFGIFAKDGLPIAWPEPTHAKKVKAGMFGSLKPWKAVREVLDFSNEGQSIFDRKTPLSEKTLERIYAGLIKYVAGGKEAFMLKYNSTDKNGVHYPPSIDEHSPVVTTQSRLGLIQPAFITKYFSGKPEGKSIPVDGPAGTVTTVDGQSLVQPKFLMQYNGFNPESNVLGTDRPMRTITAGHGVKHTLVSPEFLQQYYGNGFSTSVDTAAPTLTTKDRCALVQPQFFIDKQYGSGPGNQISIDQPAGTITGNDHHALITADQAFVMPTNFNNGPTSLDEPLGTITANRKWHYLINPSWYGFASSTDQPCPVIIARQDKAPLYMMCPESGDVAIRIDENDSACTRKIKEFMALYSIIDIKMRMLMIAELLKIQDAGTLKLEGTQSEQKKFIGNMVVPLIPENWGGALINKLGEYNVNAIAA